MGVTKRPLSRVSNPWNTFLAILLTVFTVEIIVMVFLPILLPEPADGRIIAIADSCLLTFAAAPVLWWIVIRPLRHKVVEEAAKAELILAAAAKGIITIDESGLIDTFNPAAEEIFGYSAEEILGRNLTILMPAESAAQHQQALRRCRSSKQSNVVGKTLEVNGLRKDGTQVPLQLSISQLEINGRRFFTGILRDRTEAKLRARQQVATVEFGKRALAHEQLDQLFDEAAKCIAETLDVDYTAIFQLSTDGDTLRLVHGVGWPEGLIGEAEIEACSRNSPGLAIDRTAVLDADYLDGDDAGLDLLREQQIRAGGTVVIPASPQPYGILAAYRRSPKPLTEEALHFLRDISVELALAIQRRASELQRRERDRYRADQMAKVAELATGVAHEIRNPLTSIKMLIQAGRRSTGSGLEADDMEVIESEIRRMERSLTAFLDFARPAEPERKRLKVGSLVTRTVALVRTRAARQHVQLQCTIPDTAIEAWADADQIQQLLLNLVLNSLEAMPDGGELEVALAPSSRTEFEISVADTGPGIPAELMNRLFQPFVSSKDTGVGLGLVICKRIADDHGGSLSAANREEGGVRFTLRMPAAAHDFSTQE